MWYNIGMPVFPRQQHVGLLVINELLKLPIELKGLSHLVCNVAQVRQTGRHVTHQNVAIQVGRIA